MHQEKISPAAGLAQSNGHALEKARSLQSDFPAIAKEASPRDIILNFFCSSYTDFSLVKFRYMKSQPAAASLCKQKILTQMADSKVTEMNPVSFFLALGFMVFIGVMAATSAGTWASNQRTLRQQKTGTY
jgi:hypothetical protein